jgi:hypothetical protein
MRGRLGLCLGVFLLAIGISTILINAQYSDPAAPTREYYRPLIGGIQYYADKGICTLSYAARDSTGRVGMVTARHCASQSSPLYQPDDSSISYYIGKQLFGPMISTRCLSVSVTQFHMFFI